jgi:tRNA (guanine-N7-)-methyltransferase
MRALQAPHARAPTSAQRTPPTCHRRRRTPARCCSAPAAADAPPALHAPPPHATSAAAAATAAAAALPRVPRARTRLHINPLSEELLQPLPPPDWASLLREPRLPLHLDLGCAYGEFALALAERQAGTNFVGVDLRERVLSRAGALSRPNAAFLFANARHEDFLHALLRSYPGALSCVSCLFPDPWSQARYVRRRLLQPELVAAAAAAMPPGGAFVTATDNAQLAEEMRAPFAADAATWRLADGADDAGWALSSPFPVATQWECTVRGRGSRIYWAHFIRT